MVCAVQNRKLERKRRVSSQHAALPLLHSPGRHWSRCVRCSGQRGLHWISVFLVFGRRAGIAWSSVALSRATEF